MHLRGKNKGKHCSIFILLVANISHFCAWLPRQLQCQLISLLFQCTTGCVQWQVTASLLDKFGLAMNNPTLFTMAPAMFFVFAATAAEAPLVATDDNKTADELEVIKVYAQRRAQDKTEVSVAVTSLAGEDIAGRRLQSSTELSGLAPNFVASTVSGEGTTPSFNIRGVGMFDYNTSTVSPISIYSDDVVSGGANFLSSSLFDLQQVDVLRGPQGTLFGRNTTGGAILLMSRQPESEFGGYVSLDVAEHNSRQLTAAVNAPLGEQTSARLAVNHQDYQYSMQNLFPLGQDGGMRHNNARLIIQSDFDQFSLNLKLHSENVQGAPKPIYSAGILQDAASRAPCPLADVGSRSCVDAFGYAVPSDDYWQTVADTFDKKHDTESYGGSLKLTAEPASGYQLKSVTAYKSLQRFHSFDSDGPGNFIEGSFDSDNSFFSQELSLAVQGDNSFWTSGLFYLDESLTQLNDLDLFRDFRLVPELAAIPAQFFYHNKLDNSSWSAYSQWEQTLNQTFSLLLGGRYTREKNQYQARSDLDLVPVFIPSLWDLTGEIKDNEWSGKVALLQKLSERHSLYYSLSRGFKAGGYNAGYATSPAQAADSAYAPERLNAWEIGGHWQSEKTTLSFDWAAFYYDYQDQQVFVNQTSGPAPYHVLKNAGDSQIYGVEAELNWRIDPAMQLELTLGHLPKANLGKYQTEAVLVPENRLPFTSEWMASGQFSYDFAGMLNNLQFQLGFVYLSDFYFDQYENPYTEQRGYTLWHSRLSYQPMPELEVSVFGKNLLNKEYTELRFDSIAALAAVTELRGETRQLGLGVTYQF